MFGGTESSGGGMDFQKQLAAALDAAGVPVDGSEEAAVADASVDNDAAGGHEHGGAGECVCVRVCCVCVRFRVLQLRTLDSIMCRLWALGV